MSGQPLATTAARNAFCSFERLRLIVPSGLSKSFQVNCFIAVFKSFKMPNTSTPIFSCQPTSQQKPPRIAPRGLSSFKSMTYVQFWVKLKVPFTTLKRNSMKLIEAVGLKNTSITKRFASTIAFVLFVSSHTTRNSAMP